MAMERRSPVRHCWEGVDSGPAPRAGRAQLAWRRPRGGAGCAALSSVKTRARLGGRERGGGQAPGSEGETAEVQGWSGLPGALGWARKHRAGPGRRQSIWTFGGQGSQGHVGTGLRFVASASFWPLERTKGS